MLGHQAAQTGQLYIDDLSLLAIINGAVAKGTAPDLSGWRPEAARNSFAGTDSYIKGLTAPVGVPVTNIPSSHGVTQFSAPTGRTSVRDDASCCGQVTAITVTPTAS